MLYVVVWIPAGNKCCVLEGQLQRTGSRDCGHSGFRRIIKVEIPWAGNNRKLGAVEEESNGFSLRGWMAQAGRPLVSCSSLSL